MPQMPRQEVEEGGKLRLVEFDVRRKLPEDRPELLPQFLDAAAEKAFERRPRAAEIGAVRQIARALQGEDEIRRRFVMPAPEGLRILQPVEGAVDLDGGDLPARIMQFLRLPQS